MPHAFRTNLSQHIGYIVHNPPFRIFPPVPVASSNLLPDRTKSQLCKRHKNLLKRKVGCFQRSPLPDPAT